jgi:hypothetical protein
VLAATAGAIVVALCPLLCAAVLVRHVWGRSGIEAAPRPTEGEQMQALPGTHPKHAAATHIYIEAAADWRRPSMRYLYFEDVVNACLAAAIGGWHTEPSAPCWPPALLLLLVASAHLVYLLVVRPYHQLSDRVFALLWGVCAALLASAAVIGGFAGPSSRDIVSNVVNVLLYITSTSFFVQPAVQLGIHLVAMRRQRRKRSAAIEDAEVSSATLLIPQTMDPAAQQIPLCNPLLKSAAHSAVEL